MEIVWSPRAKQRLGEYAHQLAEYDYPQTAHDWLVDVQAAVDSLSDFPRAGRISPEFTDKKPVIRDISVGKNYRVFYRVKRAALEIISVHNCKQAITSLRSL